MMLTPILILDEVVWLALRLNVVINYVFGARIVGAAVGLRLPFPLVDRCNCQLHTLYRLYNLLVWFIYSQIVSLYRPLCFAE